MYFVCHRSERFRVSRINSIFQLLQVFLCQVQNNPSVVTQRAAFILGSTMLSQHILARLRVGILFRDTRLLYLDHRPSPDNCQAGILWDKRHLMTWAQVSIRGLQKRLLHLLLSRTCLHRQPYLRGHQPRVKSKRPPASQKRRGTNEFTLS